MKKNRGGITWFSGETEGGSAVANKAQREEHRKFTENQLPIRRIIRIIENLMWEQLNSQVTQTKILRPTPPPRDK